MEIFTEEYQYWYYAAEQAAFEDYRNANDDDDLSLDGWFDDDGNNMTADSFISWLCDAANIFTLDQPEIRWFEAETEKVGYVRGNVIYLDPSHVNKWVLTHEVTHWLGFTGHGPDFQAAFVDHLRVAAPEVVPYLVARLELAA